jgi:hypothetical protein
MEPEDTKPKQLSECQSWLLMGAIFIVAAVTIWLPVFVS